MADDRRRLPEARSSISTDDAMYKAAQAKRLKGKQQSQTRAAAIDTVER